MTATMRGAARTRSVAVIALVASMLALAACRIEVGSPAAVTPCADSHPTGKVVLYTSAYRELTDGLAALVRQQLPDVELVIFQGGSEKVAGRLDADLAAGRAGADVLLVSDPLLSRRLKRDGQLLAWASPMATPVDRRLVDLDNAFVAARASTMVIAFHAEKTPRASVPTSLAALLTGADDGVSRDVAFGDPLSSGTALFTAVVVGQGDMSFLGLLRQRGASIGGGNAVVLQRVLSGERRFGVVLLENVLVSSDRGEPVNFVVPTDAVVIPGDVAIMKDTANPAAARAVVDLILSPPGQALMAGDLGRMHAVDPRIAPPAADIPPLATLLDNRPLDPTLLEKASLDRAAVLRAIEGALLHQP